MALQRRHTTLVLVALLHAAVIWLALQPMRIPITTSTETSLIVVNIPEPPPAPPAPLPGPPEPAAKAAAPAPRAVPKPVAAPKVPEPPANSPSAPAAAEGTETVSGAANAGTGSGAAGSGSGTGAGGTGAGGGMVRARRISGEITRRDHPRAARGAQGSVVANLDISPDGRVTYCKVVRSSGNSSLDEATCKLIRERFRYSPARDTSGNAIADIAGYRQDWWLEPPR